MLTKTDTDKPFAHFPYLTIILLWPIALAPSFPSFICWTRLWSLVFADRTTINGDGGSKTRATSRGGGVRAEGKIGPVGAPPLLNRCFHLRSPRRPSRVWGELRGVRSQGAEGGDGSGNGESRVHNSDQQPVPGAGQTRALRHHLPACSVGGCRPASTKPGARQVRRVGVV
ncbi:hypothetical protein GQ457_09G008490 [Hibiscus cannabinus]